MPKEQVEMNTVGCNIIIAEFMGGKLKTYNLSNEPYYLMPDKTQWMPQRMVYHSSWDSLMSVVEKIEAIHHVYEHDYINVRISKGYVTVEGTRGQKIFRNTTIEGSKIKALWLAVIDFITWYNSQKTNP